MGVKTTKMDLPIGCSFIELPSYIVNSHYMNSLNSIENNLCFFAVIALAEGCRRDRYMKRTKEIFQEFYGLENLSKEDWESYEGIQCFYQNNGGNWIQDDSEISKYELFDTRFAINIYNVLEDHSCTEIRRSPFNPEDPRNPKPHERIPIYLNLYFNHFSYIKDPDQILGFRCTICDRICRDNYKLERHMETCSTDQKFNFNKEPSVYTKKRNIIVELCDFYQVELGNLFTYDYMITYDLEAINLILPQEDSKKLEFISL